MEDPMSTYRTFLACSVSACLGLLVFALAMSHAAIGETDPLVAAAPACRTPTADSANLVAGSSYATQNKMNAACAAARYLPTMACSETPAIDDILPNSGYASHETGNATCGDPEVPVARASGEPITQTGLGPR
jgi:hypothetical protein